MPPLNVGVDLGTTTTVVAYLHNNNAQVIPDPFQAAANFTPSAVLFEDGGEPVVGEVVFNQLVERPDDVVIEVKRLISSDQKFPKRKPTRLPHEVLAEILFYRLSHLPQLADTIGADTARVIVSVPAYYGDRERRRTEQAFEIARDRLRAHPEGRRLKYELDGLVDEPLAAAINHSTETSALFADGKPFLVLDLGGGTFDITAYTTSLQKDEEKLTVSVLAKEGEQQLGGSDWDQVLIDLWREKAGNPSQLPEEIVELRLECRKKREYLTNIPETSLMGYANGQRHISKVARATFEQRAKPLLQRMDVCLDLVSQRLRDNFGIAEKECKVLLVGGAALMPMVQQHVKARFNSSPEQVLLYHRAQEAVARGACLYCAIRNGTRFANEALRHIKSIEVRDILTRSYGIVGHRATGGFGIKIVVPRNSLCNDEEYIYEDLAIRTPSTTAVSLPFGAIETVVPRGEFIPLDENKPNCVFEEIELKLPPGQQVTPGQRVRVLLRPSANGQIHGRAELMALNAPDRKVCDVQFVLKA